MILVAIGANLPTPDGAPPRESCQRAAAALDGVLPSIRLAALSRWWESEPVPLVPGIPMFVNGVARLEGATPDPAELLAALHRIEAGAGRKRPFPNAPRSLDLDLIDLNGILRDAPDPVLPHPRAHFRGFVLHPLAEVAPGWRHPRLGRTVEALLTELPPQGIWPLEE